MGNSREYIVPGRTVRIAATITHFGEVEGFQDRCAAVVTILERLRFPVAAAECIPLSFGLDVVARELALVCNEPSRPPTNGPVVTKVKKLQALARSLSDDELAASAISPEMICAIIGAANADVFPQQASPRRGRSQKMGALRLAQRFAYYYPFLAERAVGVNTSHDFVVTLDLLFSALGIQANAQHFAKLALRAPKIDVADRAG